MAIILVIIVPVVISLTFFVDNDNGNDTTQDGNKENSSNNNNNKNINRFLQPRLPSSAKGREKGWSIKAKTFFDDIESKFWNLYK